MTELGYLLRSLVFYLGYGAGVVVYGVFFLLVVPWLPLRQRLQTVSRFHRFVLAWANYACGIRYRLEGLEHLGTEPCIVASNHQSAWETYLLSLLFSPQVPVLKRELLLIPVFGWVLRLLKPIAIDRKRPTSALRQLIEQGEKRLRAGYWVVVFPEGTRVRPGEFRKFNKGAAMLATRTGISLLPVAHDAGLCWPAGRVTKRPGEVHVTIGKPIPALDRPLDAVHRDLEDWIRSRMREADGQATADLLTHSPGP